jgi:hypothetical protein
VINATKGRRNRRITSIDFETISIALYWSHCPFDAPFAINFLLIASFDFAVFLTPSDGGKLSFSARILCLIKLAKLRNRNNKTASLHDILPVIS